MEATRNATPLEHFCRAAAALLLVAATGSAAERPCSITFTFAGASGFLHAVARDSGKTREIALDEGRAAIVIGAGETWDVSLRSDRWWAAGETIACKDGGSQKREPRVWRAGAVRGKVTVAPGEGARPESIDLVIESPPQPVRPPGIARGTKIHCPVASDGTWQCRLPVTTVDLALRSKGHVPHYRWGVVVDAAKGTDLGTLSLRRGASVTAWLSRESLASLGGAIAEARIVRMLPNDPSETTARLAAPVATASFAKKGIVQLAPLPAGTYVLEVHAKGFAPARVGPIEVYERSETSIRRAVDLERPLTIELSVDPPHTPSGAAWRVAVTRLNDFQSGYDASPPVRGNVDERGRFAVADQAPGRFQIQCADANGNRFLSQDVRVRGPAEAHVALRVPVIRVSGEVTRGDDPLAATLTFGGRDGAQRIAMSSDEKGRFSGALPKGGTWPVDVRSADGVATMLHVEVPDDGSDDVTIAVPDTRVSGWVVDAEGARAANADVTLLVGSRAIQTRAAADGTFTLRGVPEGDARLVATDRKSGDESDRVRVQLREDAPLEQVVLRLTPSASIEGRVVSRGAPVAAARVAIYPIVRAGASFVRAVTDVNGAFRVDVRGGATELIVLAGAAGRTLQAYHVTDAKRPIELDLQPSGGTLHVRNWAKATFAQNGVVLPFQDLADWIRAHGASFAEDAPLIVPNLAPGHYRVCARASNHCAEGTLAPGATLELTAPR